MKLAQRLALIDRDATTDDGPIRFVGATEGVKPDGIDLRMSGVQLDRYRANPIVGFGHRYGGRDSLPIGRSEDTVVDGKRLLFDVVFDRNDEDAVRIERKYRGGFLNAVSIGFAVNEWEDPKTQNYWDGGVAVAWELYELSAVPLPADADAVVESGRSLAAEHQLFDSLRALVDRLDVPTITSLRQLVDRIGMDTLPETATSDGSAEPARSPSQLAMVKRRARLARI